MSDVTFHLAVHRTGGEQCTDLSLPEPFGGISACRVGQILGELLLDGDVIRQTDVVDHHVIRAPLVEQLDLRQFLREYRDFAIISLSMNVAHYTKDYPTNSRKKTRGKNLKRELDCQQNKTKSPRCELDHRNYI